MAEIRPIALERVNFTLAGFHQYTMNAVNLLARHQGELKPEAIQDERAFLQDDGTLVVKVFLTNGEEFSSFVFKPEDFTIEPEN